ncbi:hypothetical protein OBBRIDRAFT_804074 [Obba rivulosa]|uniref:Uncharacterized protein n=1 Tax=Obba rivulosa TaxID=1052685 RepID=A0A8E2DKB6_9APHY|nr:hypothetical protein OBBRIDRAFT_804074 [Obba rivulosa]
MALKGPSSTLRWEELDEDKWEPSLEPEPLSQYFWASDSCNVSMSSTTHPPTLFLSVSFLTAEQLAPLLISPAMPFLLLSSTFSMAPQPFFAFPAPLSGSLHGAFSNVNSWADIPNVEMEVFNAIANGEGFHKSIVLLSSLVGTMSTAISEGGHSGAAGGKLRNTCGARLHMSRGKHTCRTGMRHYVEGEALGWEIAMGKIALAHSAAWRCKYWQIQQVIKEIVIGVLEG